MIDKSKFKAFAEDKIYIAEVMISGRHKVENIVGEGEKAGYQHFLLFSQHFQKLSSFRVVKTGDYIVMG